MGGAKNLLGAVIAGAIALSIYAATYLSISSKNQPVQPKFQAKSNISQTKIDRQPSNRLNSGHSRFNKYIGPSRSQASGFTIFGEAPLFALENIIASSRVPTKDEIINQQIQIIYSHLEIDGDEIVGVIGNKIMGLVISDSGYMVAPARPFFRRNSTELNEMTLAGGISVDHLVSFRLQPDSRISYMAKLEAYNLNRNFALFSLGARETNGFVESRFVTLGLSAETDGLSGLLELTDSNAFYNRDRKVQYFSDLSLTKSRQFDPYGFVVDPSPINGSGYVGNVLYGSQGVAVQITGGSPGVISTGDNLRKTINELINALKN